MTNLKGRTTRLRAVEPGDLDLMYAWENDPDIWSISGTTTPFSRHTLEKFIENQQHDIADTHQQRFIIETLDGAKPVGILDFYDVDLLNRRAGVGILIYEYEERGKGYASDALELGCNYARTILHLHQVWSTISADNETSLALFDRGGFIRTGIRQQWSLQAEGFTDEVFLQKIL